MIIFTLRRLLLLLVTLFFLTFVGFSLSYFTPHAPLQGSSLWDAWLFWFNGLLHWDFGVSSINGQLISEQLKVVFPATMELCVLAFGFALMVGIPVGMLAGIYRNKWQDKFIRLMRISTIDVFDQNYVKAAATRGLSRLTILRRHVLHNALPPVIPRLGLQFSTMLTLAMITEMVFSWPGLGRWMINAIRQQDYAAISAGVMVIGSLVIIVNVVSDILGAMANPLKHKEWYALR